MSNNRNLGNIATAITNATSGQVLTSQGNGVATFADAGGTGVTVHNNQAAMLTDAVSADEGSLHYETANNKLYVKQSSGFFLLASITNTAPTVSGFTETTGSGSATTIADNGTFTLTSGSNTVITLTATDPDLETLVYSATVTSGTASNIISSPSLPISNQSGNTFTLTPVTSGSGGTVTIRFDVSDGNNVVNKTHSFSIVFTVVDSNHTTLLATATSTGANSTIEDSSTANSGSGHSITVNGDAYAGTFSPYRSGGYATYFGNGGSERITVEGTKSTLAGANADFSISAWIYPTAGNDKWIYGTNNAGHNQAGWHDLYLEGSTKLVWRHSDGSTNRSMMSTNPVSLNEWSYVLINRTSSVTYMYINGSLVAQNSDMTNALYTHTNAPSIGIRYFYDTSSTNLDFEGYITDVHVKTAAISSPTTVPTERAVADSDTWLLTAHLPYFADGSSNNYTVSAYNNIIVKPFSPYDYKEYSATDNGGSVYFDGSGDYLTIPSSNDFQLGTTGTINFWMYIDKTSNAGIVSGYNNANSLFIYCQNNFNLEWRDNNNAYYSATGIELFQKVWTYVSIVRSGTTLKVYLNGVEKASQPVSSTSEFGSDENLEIGNRSAIGWTYKGYLSDFQIIKGTAIVPTPSTVPIAPSATHSNSKLHLKGTDASIIDKSQGANLKLIGTTTGSTDQVRTGNWTNTKTMKFDGNSDYITIPNDEAYGFGTGDWTIETWLYCTKTGGFNAIFDTRVGTGTQTGNFGIGMYTTGRVQLFSGGIFYYPTDTLSFNTWQHLAVVKNSGTTTMYFNGTAASTTYSDSRDYGSSQPVQIGKDDTTSNYFGGYMQDFRITKGLARYTASDETANIPTAPLKG